MLQLIDDTYGKIEQILLTYNDGIDYPKVKSFMAQFDDSVEFFIAYKGTKIRIDGLSKGDRRIKNNRRFDELLKFAEKNNKKIKLVPVKGHADNWPQDSVHILRDDEDNSEGALIPCIKQAKKCGDMYAGNWHDMTLTDLSRQKPPMVINCSGGDIIPSGENVFIGAKTIWKGIDDAMHSEALNFFAKLKRKPTGKDMTNFGQMFYFSFSKKLIEEQLKNLSVLIGKRNPIIVGIEHKDYYPTMFERFRGKIKPPKESRLYSPAEYHIDLVFSPLGGNAVAIGDLGMCIKSFKNIITAPADELSKFGKNLDQLAEDFSEKGYNVVRLPILPQQFKYKNRKKSNSAYFSYNNFLTEIYNDGTEKRIIYLPRYMSRKLTPDILSKEILEAQGFEVRQIDVEGISHWGGGVRCCSKVIKRSSYNV